MLLFKHPVFLFIMKHTTIYIIGGGPAGSATALSLAQCLKSEPECRIVQVCAPAKEAFHIGETIPPAATDYLQQLGLSHCLNERDHVLCPGSLSVWGSEEPGFNDFFFTPIGQGFHLDRGHFNQQLLEAVQQAGVQQQIETKLKNVSQRDNGLELTLQHEGTLSTIMADFVVDATGIQARVARSLNVARNQYDSVISACALFDLPHHIEHKPAHTLVSTHEAGWWYAARLPNHKALVSFCTDAETLKQLNLQSATQWQALFLNSGWFYSQCRQQFGVALEQPDNVLLRVAPSAILSCVVGERWLAVGDAASSYDSMTSAGITKSLQQGLQAGQAIAQLLANDDSHLMQQYQDDIFAAFNHYLSLHQQLYHQEQRYAYSGFWSRRQY